MQDATLRMQVFRSGSAVLAAGEGRAPEGGTGRAKDGLCRKCIDIHESYG